MQTAENPPYGLATWLGIAAAAVQYVTALLILLVHGPVEASITAFVTASGALVAVLGGRYSQANNQIKAQAVTPTQPVVKVHLDGKEIASATQRSQEDADDDGEPGDAFDAHPDIPVTPHDDVPPDNSDAAAGPRTVLGPPQISGQISEVRPGQEFQA